MLTRADLEPLVRHPIRNAWYAIRIPISRSRLAARTLTWRGAGRLNRRLTRHTEACIDGFPRSGNTIAVYAFWRNNPEVRLAHHLHAAGEVERGLKRSVPTVVLVRDPAQAVSSLILYQGGTMHPRLGIETYIAFHQHLLPLRGRFAVCSFEQLLADPGLPISLLNERFGTRFLRLPLEERGREELRRAIAHTQELRGDPSRKWSVPSPERDATRASVEQAVRRSPLFATAEEIYQAYLEQAGAPQPPRAAKASGDGDADD